MSASLNTVEGIVAGGVDYGEADRVVHLLTPEGRLSVFAHGAKKSRRRFSGALDPFTSIRAQLLPSKRPDAMPTMTSAVVLDPRLNLRSDLAKIALSSYVVELAARVAPEGQAAHGIHQLAGRVLDHLASREAKATLAVRRAFELRLVAELGYQPELDRCTVCGEGAVPPHLDLVHGGTACSEHKGRGKEIGQNTLAWMRSVIGSSQGDGPFDPLGGLDPSSADRVARALTGPTGEFFASLFSRPLNSAALLEDVML